MSLELKSTRQARINKLRRARLRGFLSNPYDAPLASGVTMTVTDNTFDASLTKVMNINSKTAQILLKGGKRAVYGSGAYVVSAAINGASGTPFTGQNSWNPSMSFMTEASKVAIPIIGNAPSYPGRPIRVLVDGQYVTKAYTNLPSVNAYINLDFGGVRQPRVIEVETSISPLFTNILIPPTEDLWAPKVPDAVTHFAFGDSYGEPQGTGVLGYGFSKQFGVRAGAITRICHIGGTGYFNPGSAGQVPVRFQIPNHIALNSDVDPAAIDLATIFTGYNDYNINNSYTGNVLLTPTIMTAEVVATLGVARAQMPNALIVVGGIWTGVRNNDPTTLALENAVAAAVTQFNDPMVAFCPVSTDAAPWISGTGSVGATTGSGNADFDISADRIHPTDSGYLNFGKRLAQNYDDILARAAA